MTQVVPMLANGVPVTYGQCIGEDFQPREDFNATSFYLGTDVLLPILKVLAPVLSDEDVVNMIIELAKSDENMAATAEAFLPGILAGLPEAIETTSVIEIGINLTKAE